jgi:hypothetical protein
MKFVAKINNYSIMLRQGIPGNPLMAIPPKAGVYARFVDGQFFTSEYSSALVTEEELIDLLLKSKQCGKDFFAVTDESAADPFQKSRKASEPVHSVMEMGQGSKPGRVLEGPKQINPAIKEAAEAMLAAMMPAIISKVRESVLAENVPAQVKKAPGRPKKVENVITAPVEPEQAK